METRPLWGAGFLMPRLWIKDPLAIFATQAERGLVVEDHRIVERVSTGAEPTHPVNEIFDASAHVVLPGLINTHHHFFQTLTRAVRPAIGQKLFDWLKVLYPLWAKLTPEMLAVACELALTELLLSGCTTTADHHYGFPPGLENAIDIQVEVARRLGIRTVLTRGSMDLSVENGGLPPVSVVQSGDTILNDSERVIGTHHEAGPGAMIQIALAPCSPFSVSTRVMRETAALANTHNVRLHTHLGETADENNYCTREWGMRPLDYLESCGWLTERTWLAHGIHFNSAEIERLGRAGTAIAHCPHSNMALASGLCRVSDLEQAGSPVGLGVDGSASNDSSNAIEEVRQAMLLQRTRTGSAGGTRPEDALRWGTLGGARCLGRDDIGEIAPGLEADLALFRLDELRHSGYHDPLAALIQSGAHRADHVMVAGRWVVTDRQPIHTDESDLFRRHQASAYALRQRAGLEG